MHKKTIYLPARATGSLMMAFSINRRVRQEDSFSIQTLQPAGLINHIYEIIITPQMCFLTQEVNTDIEQLSFFRICVVIYGTLIAVILMRREPD